MSELSRNNFKLTDKYGIIALVERGYKLSVSHEGKI